MIVNAVALDDSSRRLLTRRICIKAPAFSGGHNVAGITGCLRVQECKAGKHQQNSDGHLPHTSSNLRFAMVLELTSRSSRIRKFACSAESGGLMLLESANVSSSG